MYNLFKLRKVNSVLKNFSDSYLGMNNEKIDNNIKEFYENKLEEYNIKFKINLY
jgi:hypothetical protein